jgi:hypothetical protein
MAQRGLEAEISQKKADLERYDLLQAFLFLLLTAGNISIASQIGTGT